MFTVIAREEMLKKLELALENELASLVTMFPQFKQSVEKNLLWAIFSENDLYEEPEEKYRHYSSFAYLSYDMVKQAKAQLQKQGYTEVEFFVSSVDKAFQEKDLHIYLDSEDCDLKIAQTTPVEKTMKKNVEAMIVLTLPDSSVVFESMCEGDVFNPNNRWLWEYMETYDNWKYDIMAKYYNYLWQIGGHGRWIQSDYNNTYVAQANIRIGDAGSVFVEFKDNQAEAYVDMY